METILIQQADIILSILQNVKTAITYETLLKRAKDKDSNIHDWILDRVIEKLTRDNYMYTRPNKSLSITLEGILFIGYEKQQKLDTERVVKISRTEADLRSYKNRLLWATWCAGIAAVLLLLWQVFVYMYPLQSDWFYFWFQTIPAKKP